MKTLTVEWLKEHGACLEKTEKFAKHYPDGMELTLKNLRKLVKAGVDDFIDYCWLGKEILPFYLGDEFELIIWEGKWEDKREDKLDATLKLLMRYLRKMWKEEKRNV